MIAKKSLLIFVPPESDEISLYYVTEGISLRNKNKWAKHDLDALRMANFTFLPSEAEAALKFCEFEELRFFVDPASNRQLCAERRMKIPNRSEFAEFCNQTINKSVEKAIKDLDEYDIKNGIKIGRAEYAKTRPGIEGMVGPIPMLEFIDGVLAILEEYDVDSIRQIRDAVQADFRWLRFETNSVQFVIPATVECATRIVANPRSVAWLNRMRINISPIELLQGSDGLVISLGLNGQLIRVSFADDTGHDPAGEKRVVELAEFPEPIMVHGKAESADSLVEKFIFEKTGFRKWNDVTGRFAITAKFGGNVGSKVLLIKEDGSKVYISSDQLGIADRDYLDVEKK